MKSYIHEVVRRLLELHALEERLTAFRRNTEAKRNVATVMESLRAKLPEGVQTAHDQMRSRGKRSVAEVHHGVCCGCHIALGMGNVAALQRGEMRRCGNCGRFVYVVDDETASAGLPTKMKKGSRSRREPAAPILAG